MIQCMEYNEVAMTVHCLASVWHETSGQVVSDEELDGWSRYEAGRLVCINSCGKPNPRVVGIIQNGGGI